MLTRREEMNLLQIRTKWVDTNGRTDLVVDTTDYTDNGANFFIQAGQRLLDSLLPFPGSKGRYVKDIAADDYKLMMKYIRAIDSVWIKASGEDRVELDRKSYSWLLEEYGDSISDMDSGEPTYYAPIIHTISPEQKDLTDATYSTEFTHDYEDILFGSTRYQKRGIAFRPKADQAYTMTVFAHFFSLMSSDADISWHSEQYPELLVLASNWALEAFYKNRTGMQDWMEAIQQFLRGIDHDSVREEMVLAGNQLKG